MDTGIKIDWRLFGEQEPEVISQQQVAIAAASIGESDDERDDGSVEQESSIAIGFRLFSVVLQLKGPKNKRR